jgi:hypothetical protein
MLALLTEILLLIGLLEHDSFRVREFATSRLMQIAPYTKSFFPDPNDLLPESRFRLQRVLASVPEQLKTMPTPKDKK